MPDKINGKGAPAKKGLLRLQGLALILFIICPLGAYFFWQQGLFFLTVLCILLLAFAFILTILKT